MSRFVGDDTKDAAFVVSAQPGVSRSIFTIDCKSGLCGIVFPSAVLT